MFKIKISDLAVYGEKKNRYCILYERIPDISKGIENRKIHESIFSNLTKAQIVATDLGHFLNDSYLFLELVYTKLKQLEISDTITEKYLKVDFNKIESIRIDLIKSKTKTLFAYQHIEKLQNYLDVLKYWCFQISKEFYETANLLFRFLLSFEEHFKNSYRSAKMLSEKHNLKLFI